MHCACWLSKATNTHSEYIIIAFARQLRLSEYCSVLSYECTACLVTRVLLKTKGRAVMNRVRVSPDKRRSTLQCLKDGWVMLHGTGLNTLTSELQPKCTGVFRLRRIGEWRTDLPLSVPNIRKNQEFVWPTFCRGGKNFLLFVEHFELFDAIRRYEDSQ